MDHNNWRMDDPITSERFRTVAALAGFSSAFEALFRAAPSPFLVITPPDYAIIAVNEAYLRATMTERAAVLGRGLFEVFPDNPEDPSIEGPPKLRESLKRVVADRRLDQMPIVRYDIPRPAALGGGFEERWWSPRNAPVLDSNGEVVCIIHHVEDVTGRVRAEAALRTSEHRFHALAMATSDVLYHMSPDWREMITLEGNALIPDAAESFRDWLYRYIPQDEQPRVLDAIHEAIKTKAIFALEHRVLRADGTEGWSYSRAVPLLDDAGEITEWIGAAADISERKRAEQALRENEQRLRSAVGERDALLKEAHHRVKNNLQVITSLLEMQARQTADRQALSLLSEARNRITTIAAIHELLYQSGSFSEVDLAAYARRLVRHVVSLYDENHEIEAYVDGEGITIDLARAVPFGLLLNELVSNAYKHAFRSRAGGELRVGLCKDDVYIRLQVTDTGVGLPSGFNERPPTTLGLQLVGMLTKQLGGTVTFDSAGGTRVGVRVPTPGKIS